MAHRARPRSALLAIAVLAAAPHAPPTPARAADAPVYGPDLQG